MTPRYKLDGYDLDKLYPTRQMPAQSFPAGKVQRTGRETVAVSARKNAASIVAVQLVFAILGVLAIVTVASSLPVWLIGADSLAVIAVWAALWRFIIFWRTK